MSKSKLTNFLKNIRLEAQTFFYGHNCQTAKSDKSKLDLDEYNMREMQKNKEDSTDKVKPYDNLETKIFHPELREQYENRKDTFHTLDTPYIKKENEEKKDNMNRKERSNIN